MKHLLALLLVLALAPACAGSCDATSTVAAVRAAQSAGPAVGPGYVDGYKVSCTDPDAGPAEITTPGQVSYSCTVSEDGGTVWVGGSDVANDGSTGGEPFTAGERVNGDIKKEYCRSASGTVVLYCRAMIARDQ